MSLVDIFVLELPFILDLVQERVLQLRLVSKRIMMALELNSSMKIKFRISVAGTEHLSADFLRRWNGRVHLGCEYSCTPDSRWFNTVKDALLSTRLRPLSLLTLSIDGNHLNSLVETLVLMGTAIQQLEIAYRGGGKEILAAATPIASLGRTLTMKISVEGRDRRGRQASLWLQRLAASSIRINSISFRSVCWLTSSRTANSLHRMSGRRVSPRPLPPPEYFPPAVAEPWKWGRRAPGARLPPMPPAECCRPETGAGDGDGE